MHDALPVPRHVAIVGLGPSSHAYIDKVESLGGRKAFCDETWVINTYGDVIAHDRVFLMDDVANVAREVADEKTRPEVRAKLENMLAWLKTHPGPVYTSVARPGFPGMVAYPLEDVLNSVGATYFNNTVAYAVAFAISLHIREKKQGRSGIEHLSLYGCDYSYGDVLHEGRGRGCLEFWLGYATAHGIMLHVGASSSLLDTNEPERKFYGYEAVKLGLVPVDGKVSVSMVPRKDVQATVDLETL